MAPRKPEVGTQQIGERALAEPLAMQEPFASGRNQPVSDEHEQHLIPPRPLAARPQTFAPEAVQPKLSPQRQNQPTGPKLTRSTQTQPRQLHADDRGVRHKPFTAILGK